MSTKTRPTLADVRKWPATVGVTETAEALGISRAYLYDLVKRGQAPVRVLTFGTKHRVVTASIVALLEAA
ncbi:DNA-binding protein [Streptomyces sp. NPDC057430]|uniref:DNA-binding protein n=1 Tax=Streptomyces sp. NPDC057430 TaxID=3346131 RepID=UPI00368CCC93